MVASAHVSRILYPTDFSRQSATALPYALSVARRYGAELFVVHVVAPAPLPVTFPSHTWHAIVAQATREARAAIEETEVQLKDVAHQVRLSHGNVSAELFKIVEVEKIDLIILATHGRTGISKVLLGSVAENIFRHAPCPVLTIGPRVSGAPECLVNLHSILHPTDLGPDSQAALAYAISLARQNMARLYLLHVIPPDADSDEAPLLTRLGNLVPAKPELSCEPKCFVRAGEAGQAILDLAEEMAVDLIVLGPKRHSGLPGSMATVYRVATQSICPVLTVRG